MSSCRVLVYASLIHFLLSTPAAAQEQAQDEKVWQQPKAGLEPSARLEHEKRDQAREGGWAWTILGRVAAGFDSNIYEGSSNEKDSLVYDLGMKADGLRTLDSGDRLSLSFKATATPYLETSKVAQYSQKVSGRYARRLAKPLVFSLSGYLKHENDGETDSTGHDFSRDYEHLGYRISPSLRFKPTRNQSIRVSFPLKWKDYEETTGKSSLDWWEYGPSARYSVDLGLMTLKLKYAFVVRQYDSNPASLSSGVELASNPDEEHDYHKFDAELGLRPHEKLELTLGYRFRSKDDQFQGFESYDEDRWEIGAAFSPMRAWVLRAQLSYAERDYDKRAGGIPGENLELDTLRTHFVARYEISKNLAFYTQYTFTDRDSNRLTGRSYRDYEVHRFFSGVTLGY